MRYCLYGKINDAAFEDVKHISQERAFLMNDPINNSDMPFDTDGMDGLFFQITALDWDCEIALGSPKAHVEDLIKFKEWLHSLKKSKKIRTLGLIKYWEDGEMKKLDEGENVHINDIDTIFLFNFQPNVMYKILYYVRNAE